MLLQRGKNWNEINAWSPLLIKYISRRNIHMGAKLLQNLDYVEWHLLVTASSSSFYCTHRLDAPEPNFEQFLFFFAMHFNSLKSFTIFQAHQILLNDTPVDCRDSWPSALLLSMCVLNLHRFPWRFADSFSVVDRFFCIAVAFVISRGISKSFHYRSHDPKLARNLDQSKTRM